MNEICEILIRINQLEFEQGGKSKVKIGPSRFPASTKRLKTSAFKVSSCSFSENEFVNLPWPILTRHSQQRTNPQWPEKLFQECSFFSSDGISRFET